MSSVVDDVVEGTESAPDIISVMEATKPAFLLSLDVGTSGVRAALFDESGNEVAGSKISSRRLTNPFSAFNELNPNLMIDQVIETVDGLFENSFHTTANVAHVVLSCFWHSLMGIDATNRPTTQLLTWADTRASQFATRLRSRFDEKDVHTRTGCRFHPSYWPAKLQWLQSQHQDLFRRTERWLGFSEYLSLRLFDDSAASVSMASATGLFNQFECDWDWDLVDELGISADALPEVTHGQNHPNLSSEFVERWPALAEAKLLTVVGDGAANNIGAGCCKRDQIALMIGTSGAMRVSYRGDPPGQLPSSLWCYRADGSRMVVGGALSDGGGLYSWFTELMSLGNPIGLEEDLSEMEPDSHGLTVLPFWSGERSTGWSVDARGGILGLTQRTKPAEILRAAMEAVAYRFALIAQALENIAPRAEIIATGNALRSSPVWLQILADVLGRPIIFGGSSEASIRGAALLGLETLGKIGAIDEVPVEVDAVFEPDMRRHARYQNGLARQELLYDRLMRE